MKSFIIYWEGTVTGTSTVEANSIEEAIDIAKSDDYECEDGIDIEFYPEDWKVDEGTTESLNKDEEE